MKELKRDELNPLIESGKDILLFFFDPNHPVSTLAYPALEEVNGMVGRSFDIFLVNACDEPEIKDAFSVNAVPEFISVKNKKIHKRAKGILFSNQILDLLK
jgi:thioredoxin-like negative regulator of GroEL